MEDQACAKPNRAGSQAVSALASEEALSSLRASSSPAPRLELRRLNAAVPFACLLERQHRRAVPREISHKPSDETPPPDAIVGMGGCWVVGGVQTPKITIFRSFYYRNILCAMMARGGWGARLT